MVMAVVKWKHYLMGYHFIIKTDHQSLKLHLDHKLTTTLQHKCFAKLLGMDYEIQYRKGSENLAADALSRKQLIPGSEAQLVAISGLNQRGCMTLFKAMSRTG